MAFLDRSRWFSLASIVALGALGAAGCAADNAEGSAVSSEDGSSRDDITQVDQTEVKRQSIGNCWLYATSSWLEALNKGATGEAQNTSESWLTYWHWFEQLANGRTSDEISTGGSYGTATGLISRYGLMNEGDFVPAEADAEMSNRQSRALAAVNASLKSGVLSDPAVRRDRAAIRAELDKAWALDAEQIRRIDTVFGSDVERTLDRSSQAARAASSSKIIVASEFAARLRDPDSGEMVNRTLADAIGVRAPNASASTKYAFRSVSYPYRVADRREFWKRVQRQLHDQIPVVTSWKVDFNALTRDSRFSKDELDRRGPGKQGGHMTVMHDYQAEVPGLGLLEAGKQATPEEMEKALADGTKIQFVRVKNSWGGIRPDRWDDAVLPGYHDLEMAYIDGPIKDCEQDDEGNTDLKRCDRTTTPLWDVVLQAGY